MKANIKAAAGRPSPMRPPRCGQPRPRSGRSTVPFEEVEDDDGTRPATPASLQGRTRSSRPRTVRRRPSPSRSGTADNVVDDERVLRHQGPHHVLHAPDQDGLLPRSASWTSPRCRSWNSPRALAAPWASARWTRGFCVLGGQGLPCAAPQTAEEDLLAKSLWTTGHEAGR